MYAHPVISVICPAYNESSVIDTFLGKLIPVLDEAKESYEVIFINDGSKDDTLNVLKSAKVHHPQIRIINLSRNFGKEAALTAGIDAAKGEVVIPIDADLQHPPRN